LLLLLVFSAEQPVSNNNRLFTNNRKIHRYFYDLTGQKFEIIGLIGRFSSLQKPTGESTGLCNGIAPPLRRWSRTDFVYFLLIYALRNFPSDRIRLAILFWADLLWYFLTAGGNITLRGVFFELQWRPPPGRKVGQQLARVKGNGQWPRADNHRAGSKDISYRFATEWYVVPIAEKIKFTHLSSSTPLKMN
jgi:hypothetical protein